MVFPRYVFIVLKLVFFPDTMKYYTLDNGDRPFMVKVEPKSHSVCIYREIPTLYNEGAPKPEDYEHKIDIKGYKTFIAGKNTGVAGTKVKHSAKYPTIGNSVIIGGTNKAGKNEYVFVGLDVESFVAPQGDKIIQYFSPIGNNDVPYPFAVGEKFIYFISDGKYAPKSVFSNKVKTPSKWDPYQEMYNFSGKFDHVVKNLKKLKTKVLIKRPSTDPALRIIRKKAPKSQLKKSGSKRGSTRKRSKKSKVRR